jgi:deoxycytidylate deaminase
MTPYDLQYHLFELACNSKKFAGAKICAAIVKNNKIRAIGFNQNKSHPFQKKISLNKEKIYLHAEVDVIDQVLKSGIDLVGSSIFVIRAKANKEGKCFYGLSHPCDDCFNLIKSFRIKNLYYSSNDGALLKVKLN